MTAEMLISVDPKDPTPIYLQLAKSVTELIERGMLKSGEKMPSVRSLALKLAINPNTIQKAYTELEHRGKLKNEAGRGCFVSEPDEKKLKTREEIRAKLIELISAAKEAGIRQDEIEELKASIYNEEINSKGDK
ncbi:MAG: GntR family transcriptional regulator [Ruminococcaceae bacterium]|nr:GntR family transcriptional regulator [Oscillospiraceae bacterium]